MPRSTYHHGNLREDLGDAAVELVRGAGPEAVTVRELARQLEVSPAAIYRHFLDRDAVLAEVARRARMALAHRMADAQGGVRRRDPRARAVERVLAVGRAYLTFAREEPNLLAVAFLPFQAGTPEPEEPNPWGVLVGALDEVLRVGAMPPERRPGAELIAWSTVHGFAILRSSRALQTSGVGEPDQEALLQGIARALGLDPR